MVMTGITPVTLLHWSLLIRVDPYFLIHFNCESQQGVGMAEAGASCGGKWSITLKKILSNMGD